MSPLYAQEVKPSFGAPSFARKVDRLWGRLHEPAWRKYGLALLAGKALWGGRVCWW